MSLFTRIKSSKASRYFLELLLVFAGVYLAFLMNKYQEAQNTKAEKIRVLTAVKYELEHFRLSMPSQADFMERKVKEWERQSSNDTLGNFFTWRYLEPQYNYQIIEYALNVQNPKIISLELYAELSEAYIIIRHLEQAERRMTAFGDQFQNMKYIEENKDGDEYKARKADNRFYFYKFRRAADDRANSLKELGEVSTGILTLINSQFTKKQLKKSELELLRERLKEVEEEEFQDFKALMLKNFKNITEREIDKLYKEVKN